MSDAPAASVTENGVPPATQEQVVEEAPGFKVFAGNLAYSTTDEGLKAFFAPVASDMYVPVTLHSIRWQAIRLLYALLLTYFCLVSSSISAQVIMRGTRSAGYGFVALVSAEAAQKAVEALDKKELDGRPIIVEVAKPAEEKDKDRKEKKARSRRPGRRGAKAVPGEVTEAEANGEADKTDDSAPAFGDAEKLKKKKKRSTKLCPTHRKSRRALAERVKLPMPLKVKHRPSRPARGEPPRPPRAVGEEPVGEPSKTVLFVANLGFNIDDAGLAALFTDAGIKVNSARIVRRRWGRPRKSKGYGFVDVGDEEEQKKAIETLEGKDVGGRPIAVKIAVNPQTEEEEEEKEEESPAPVVVAAEVEEANEAIPVEIVAA
ncbi:hypothetical protein EW146_g3218 [Bondarzewia mesenterica]|uniref:RRM domain-containing protein n=1 Tax=Bondarzewia mesenterica TaxID=1095465 RepID=A0A4S4M003_9AGAM|nr:hypothetical protein EW146_g3218 [Bondarzewia mesenterica]